MNSLKPDLAQVFIGNPGLQPKRPRIGPNHDNVFAKVQVHRPTFWPSRENRTSGRVGNIFPGARVSPHSEQEPNQHALSEDLEPDN